MPHFQSEYFNICCDETFDLKAYDDMGYDSGKLYVDFVKKIVEHVQQDGPEQGIFHSNIAQQQAYQDRIGCLQQIAAVLSSVFKYLLPSVSFGFAIIISAVAAAVIGAILFPIELAEKEEEKE